MWLCSAAAEGFPLSDHGKWVTAEALLFSLDMLDQLDNSCDFDWTEQANKQN